MNHITINGEQLEIIKSVKSNYDYFYYKGILLDEQPTNKKITGYVKTSNNEYVAIIASTRLKFVIFIITILLMAFIILIIKPWNLFNKPDESYVTKIDLSDKEVTSNKFLKGNIVLLKYRRFVSYVNGSIDLCIVNGNKPATIKVSGKGVSSEEIQLNSDEEMYYLPVTIDSEIELISAQLHYTVDGGTEKTYDITIENPSDQKLDNNKDATLQYEEVIVQ